MCPELCHMTGCDTPALAIRPSATRRGPGLQGSPLSQCGAAQGEPQFVSGLFIHADSRPGLLLLPAKPKLAESIDVIEADVLEPPAGVSGQAVGVDVLVPDVRSEELPGGHGLEMADLLVDEL